MIRAIALPDIAVTTEWTVPDRKHTCLKCKLEIVDPPGRRNWVWVKENDQLTLACDHCYGLLESELKSITHERNRPFHMVNRPRIKRCGHE